MSIEIIRKKKVVPALDNKTDLGVDKRRWANIYAHNVYTNDLHLKNERGDWTIIEEEDYLSITNNKTGKRYKFVLEEIDD
tara:strand:+ start:1937 stop:2176 length:240 start_codon:yes stop_codon:yes gene_type:complete